MYIYGHSYKNLRPDQIERLNLDNYKCVAVGSYPSEFGENFVEWCLNWLRYIFNKDEVSKEDLKLLYTIRDADVSDIIVLRIGGKPFGAYYCEQEGFTKIDCEKFLTSPNSVDCDTNELIEN